MPAPALTANVLTTQGYQLGLGNQLQTAEPFDFYVPLTGFSIAPQTSLLVINPAGTLATGTVTMPSNPSDGQKLTIFSTQTQTALTLTPGSGDTVNSGTTALVAGTPVTYRYTLNGAVNSSGVVVNTRTWFKVNA